MTKLSFGQIGTWNVKMTDSGHDSSHHMVFEFEMVLAPNCTMSVGTSNSFTYAWPTTSKAKWAEISSNVEQEAQYCSEIASQGEISDVVFLSNDNSDFESSFIDWSPNDP